MREVSAKAFGSHLRRLRLSAEMSQEALAERSGLSVRAIADLERGRRSSPRLATLGLLADALKLDDRSRASFFASARAELAAAQPTTALPRPTSWSGPTRASLTRLPIPPTRLIGRDAEVAAVRARLIDSDTRLVTLTGPGGVGKTRLALEVGALLAQGFEDGVVFVDLASVFDPDLVESAVARALGVGEHGGRPLADAITAFVTDRTLLVILDNCEQVLSGIGIAARLLAAAAGLRLLATSRERLNLRGEREVQIAPLSLVLTGDKGSGSADDLSGVPAIRLFVERGDEAVPGFCLTNANASVVRDICRRLDGLPLAIELAAAQLRYFSPTDLLVRLRDPFSTLIGGPRDLPVRHQTLRDAIAWSHELLTQSDRHLFRCLSVFVDGWNTEAIAEVAARTDIETGLVSLRDKHLVIRSEGVHGGRRWGTLETLREFGFERLVAAGELDIVRKRHAAYFRSLVERAAPRLVTEDAEPWFERLDNDHGNILAALSWASEQPDPDIVLEFVQHLGRFWYVRGYFREARIWLERALARGVEARAELRADALYAASMMARAQADYAAAVTFADEALAVSRTLGDDLRTLQSLYILGNLAMVRGELAFASAQFEEGLSLARALDDSLRIGSLLNVLGEVARAQGDYPRAALLIEEGLALKEKLGDAEGMAWCLHNLGSLAIDRGDLTQATDRLSRALELFRQIGNRAGIASALANLGDASIRRGDDRAVTLLRESLTIYAELDDSVGSAYVVEDFAKLAAGAGDGAFAVRLLSAAETARQAAGEEVLVSRRAALDETLAHVAALMDQASFDSIWDAASTTPLAIVVAEALARTAEDQSHNVG